MTQTPHVLDFRKIVRTSLYNPFNIAGEFSLRLGKFLAILQGLGVGPGSATERWPFRKRARKSAFFRKKIKIT